MPGNFGRNGFGPVFLDRCVNFFVNEAFQFAIPAAVFIVTGEPALAAVVFGLEWVSRLAFLFFGGTLIDRLGAVAAAKLAWLVRAATGLVGLAGVLLAREADGITATMLAACGVVSAGFFQIGFVANERLAADVVDRGSRAEDVQSRLGAVDQAALIGGPVLGGALLLLGVPALLAVYSLAMVVGLLSTRAALDRRPSPVGTAAGTAKSGTAIRNSVQAVRTVVSHRLLRITMLSAMAVNIVLAVVLATLASVMGLVYGHDPRAASLITSVGGAISLVTILLTPVVTRRFGYARCLWTMTAVTVGAGAVATYAPGILLFTVLLTVVYIGDSVVAMVARSVRIRVIPRESYSSLMSATVFLNFLPMPFAGLLIGGLVEQYGLRFTWVAMSMIALALGVGAWVTAHSRSAQRPGLGGGLEILYEKTR